MRRHFVSAKRLIRYFSNSSKLVEHPAQSPVCEVKMLAVWPSITDGFPTAKFTIYMQWKLSNTCKELKFCGWYDAAFRLGQDTHQILFEFQQTRWASCSKSLGQDENAASYQPQNLNSSHVFDNFSLYIIVNFALGNPSAIEGQTANILTLRTGLWAQCSTSLLEFENYLTSLSAETKRRVIPATKFFRCIWQFFIVFKY